MHLQYSTIIIANGERSSLS